MMFTLSDSVESAGEKDGGSADNMYVIYIYSPTKVKHHLTCFNNIFSNNELISNQFAVFVTCTHILAYL